MLAWWDGRRLFGQQPGQLRSEGGEPGRGATPGTVCSHWLSTGCCGPPPRINPPLLAGTGPPGNQPAPARDPLAGRGPRGNQLGPLKKSPSLWTPDGARVGSAGGCGEKWAPVGPCGPAEGRPERPHWPASSLSPSFRGFVDGLRHRAQHRVLWFYSVPARLSLFFCPLLLRRLSLVLAASDAARPGCTRFPALMSETESAACPSLSGRAAKLQSLRTHARSRSRPTPSLPRTEHRVRRTRQTPFSATGQVGL